MPRLRSYAFAATITLLVAFIYWPSLHGQLIWDDWHYLPYYRPYTLFQVWFTPQATFHYYPLTFTTFWLQHELWGLWPLPYHIVNALFHLANTFLLWKLLRLLKLPFAEVAALLFAVHPMQVESVAWISERKNVMGLFFYLLSAWFFIKYDELKRWPRYAFSLIFFFLSMISKTMFCTLPIALWIWSFYQKGRLEKRIAILTLPHLLIGFVMGLITVYVETQLVTKQVHSWNLDFSEKILSAAKSFWFYLYKIIWPQGLAFVYPKWSLEWMDWKNLGLLLIPLIAIILWKKQKSLGRGPLALFAFYGISIAPVLGLIDIFYFRYAYAANHFVYLAILAPLLGIAWLIWRLTQGAYASFIRVTALAGILTLTGLSHNESATFKSEEAIFKHSLQHYPNTWLANNNLGVELARQNRLEEARPYWIRASQIWPEGIETFNNLGLLEKNVGNIMKAKEYFKRALEQNPSYAMAHHNLADVYIQEKRWNQAIFHLREAIKNQPLPQRKSLSLRTLIPVLTALKQYNEAVAAWDDLIRVDPSYTVIANEAKQSLITNTVIARSETTKQSHRAKLSS